MWSWIKYKALRLYAQMIREKAPPEYVARGWALGMFIGCVVPFGFQLLVSIPLSFTLKGSKIGAVLGTFVTNPLTIFFIYPAQCWLADRIFFSGHLSYSHLCNTEWSYDAVMELGSEAVQAFFVGGFLFAAVFTPLTYWGVLKLVRRHRARVAAAHAANVERRRRAAKESAG